MAPCPIINPIARKPISYAYLGCTRKFLPCPVGVHSTYNNIIVWIVTSDGDPQFQHAAVQRQAHELLTCRVVSDEEHDAVFAGRFDLELDAELLHVEIRSRGHGQE